MLTFSRPLLDERSSLINWNSISIFIVFVEEDSAIDIPIILLRFPKLDQD